MAKKFEGPVTAVVSSSKRSFIFGATWHVVISGPILLSRD